MRIPMKIIFLVRKKLYILRIFQKYNKKERNLNLKKLRPKRVKKRKKWNYSVQ